jgi:hypothetical protein
LDTENYVREVKGLEAAGKLVDSDRALLLAESIQPGLEVPGWIRITPVVDWLLE